MTGKMTKVTIVKAVPWVKVRGDGTVVMVNVSIKLLKSEHNRTQGEDGECVSGEKRMDTVQVKVVRVKE